jgi:hypothetical protein
MRSSTSLAISAVQLVGLVVGLAEAGCVAEVGEPGDELAIADEELSRDGIRVGFGATTNSYDGLHLLDGRFGAPDEPGTVAHHLRELHSTTVHVRVPWCRLEPRPGDFSRENFERVRTWIENALAGGQRTVLSIDTWAPVFARHDPMQRDRDGRVFDAGGCGRPDGAYPDGAPSPARTDRSLDHFEATVDALLGCLRGDPDNPAGCTGEDLLPHLGMEIGDESNWFGSWQNGVCASGRPWYRTGLTRDGRTCLDGNGPVGTIHRADADFYGEMANRAALMAHRRYDFHRIGLGGIFMPGGQWGSNHADGAAYFERLYDRVRDGAWTYTPGRHWDKVGPHIGGRSLDATSVIHDIETIRAILRRKEPDSTKAIWITGLFTEEPDPQEQAERIGRIWRAVVARYSCTDWHPVRMLVFSRLPDPTDGHLRHIGFMDGGDAPATDPSTWRRKPVFDHMRRLFRDNLDCRER